MNNLYQCDLALEANMGHSAEDGLASAPCYPGWTLRLYFALQSTSQTRIRSVDLPFVVGISHPARPYNQKPSTAPFL